jgi:hypothetical protein
MPVAVVEEEDLNLEVQILEDLVDQVVVVPEDLIQEQV